MVAPYLCNSHQFPTTNRHFTFKFPFIPALLTFNVDIMVTKTRNVVVFLDYATFPARALIVVPLDGATTGTESACVLL